MTIRDISVAFGFDVDRASQAQAENSIKGLKSMATKLLGKIAVVFSVTKLASFAKDCVEAASNVEEMENKFNTVFDHLSDEVDQWAEDFANSVGRNKNTIKTYLADQQNLLVGFGMTREEGAKLSEQMTTLALDIASFSNMDEDQAVNALTKAVMGESEAAKTLGAVLNDDTRAETMLALGMQGTYQSLSQLEKMEVNYQTILRQSPDAIGDCVRSMGSYESSMRQMKAAQEEFKEFIGGQLLPVFAVFVQWMTKGIKLCTQFAKAILLDAEGNNRILLAFERIHAVVKRLQPAIDRFTQSMRNGITRATDTIKSIVDKMGGMEKAMKLLAIIAGAFLLVMNWSKIIGGAKAFLTLIQGIGKLFTLANLKILAIVAVIVLLALIVEDFINFLLGNDSVIGTIFDRMGIGADNARQAIFKAFGKIKEFLLNVWDFLKTAAGMWIDTVKGFFERHGEQIRKNFERAWGIIKTFLSGVWTFISQLAATLFGDTEDTIDGSQQSTKDKLLAVWQAILDALSAIWDAIFEVANAVFNALATVIETVFKWIEIFWNAWGSDILAWFKVLWNSLGGILNGFLEIIKGVANFISAVFRGDWEGAWEAIKQIFKGVWDVISNILTAWWEYAKLIFKMGLSAIKSVWEAVWNGIKSFFTGILDWIESKTGVSMDGVKTIFSNVLNIIKTVFSTVFENIKAIVSGAFEIIKTVVSTVMNVIKSIIGVITSAIHGDWKGVWENIKNIISSVWDGILNIVSTILSTIWTVISNIMSAILSIMQNIWENIKAVFQTALDVIFAIWQAVWGAISGFFQGIWNGIVSFLSGAWSTITGLVSGAMSGIQSVISSVLSAIQSFFSNIFSSIGSVVTNTFSSMVSGVTSQISNVKNAIVNGLTSAINWIKQLPSQALQWGADIISGIADGIKGAISKVTDAVSGVANKIKSFLHFSVPDEGPLTDFQSWMPDFMSGLAEGIGSSEDTLLDKVRGVASGISTLMQAATASAGTAASSQINNTTSNMTQNVNISNSYSGGSAETQKNVSKAMNKSAVDATTQMARGLAYARG